MTAWPAAEAMNRGWPPALQLTNASGGQVQCGGSSPKSVAAQGAAREGGRRVKPMVPPCGMGIGCERSVSPGQPGRKIQARAGDFSVPKRFLFAAEGSRCRPSALRTDSERRGPRSFARFAGFTTLTLCPPRLAPWAFIYRPLRGLVFPLLSLHFWERNRKKEPCAGK